MLVQQCKELVHEYLPQIVKLITEMPPQAVCASLGLCGAGAQLPRWHCCCRLLPVPLLPVPLRYAALAALPPRRALCPPQGGQAACGSLPATRCPVRPRP